MQLRDRHRAARAVTSERETGTAAPGVASNPFDGLSSSTGVVPVDL
jgi:hypothetical protein